jgi:riboflavin kinase/FMN adenylyltransferase
MQVIRFRTDLPDTAESVLTIGNFDGVHLGHQALIRKVVEKADRMGARSVLLTFDPHPQSVLSEHQVPILTTLAQRLKLFEQFGVDVVSLIPFDRRLAQKTAETFVEEYITRHFKLKQLVIGYDFAFGHNREGTAAVLEAFSRRNGFSFEVFPAVVLGEEVVSSTRIRNALRGGDFALAERLLGRPYSVLAPVLRGPQRGRQLGFPTLNMVPEDPLPLSFGVFAARAVVGGRTLAGVSNYGLKPTVGVEAPTLETHLFDFDGEVYGETVEVFPLQRLREERRFASLDELKAQIARDCDEARAFHSKRRSG